VYLRFAITAVSPGETLRIEWVAPDHAVASILEYPELPTPGPFCILTQMPVGGEAASSQPGRWTARIVSGGARLEAAVNFDIVADPNENSRFRLAGVTRRETPDGNELVLRGTGFDALTTVIVAQYTQSGGWRYLTPAFPAEQSETTLVVRLGKLPPAEYLAIARDANGKPSLPARFVIATANGYKLPVPPGEAWVLTQGPNGGFSHYGRSQHAWDIAPRRGTCIVAMRGGVVEAHDFGYGQTPHLRIFGNYVTIAHDDGQYSHYAHLEARSFVVKTGQRVEQGQALARVGNSGYSFGKHVHVHVTAARPISAQSIPFRFEDLGHGPAYRGPIASRNGSTLGDCGRPQSPGRSVSSNAADPEWRGAVAVGEWWSEVTHVPRGSAALRVRLGWDGKDQELGLLLVGPDGRPVGSGAEHELEVPGPQAGPWRIQVQGTRGPGERMPFRVFVDR
jgi:murein DD-endopeptidase MepM/ murein hydrolase activator NlpD